MPPRDRFVEYCQEQFAALGRIDTRYLFGGWCLYCDGTVFALIANGELYLKADQSTIPAFTARGLQPFRPFPDKDDVMKYYQAPPEIFEDKQAMRHWCGDAISVGLRAAKKGGRKKKT